MNDDVGVFLYMDYDVGVKAYCGVVLEARYDYDIPYKG